MTLLINPWMFLFWVVGSWVIGMLGRETRFGFVGNFLVAFLFSPLVGLIVLLASERRRRPPALRRKS